MLQVTTLVTKGDFKRPSRGLQAYKRPTGLQSSILADQATIGSLLRSPNERDEGATRSPKVVHQKRLTHETGGVVDKKRRANRHL